LLAPQPLVAGPHYRQGKRLEGESLLSPGEFAAGVIPFPSIFEGYG
jgi:hypothetical protein